MSSATVRGIFNQNEEHVGTGADLRIEPSNGAQISETHNLKYARYQYTD